MNSIRQFWQFDVTTFFLLTMLCVFYVVTNRNRSYKKTLSFFSGIVLIALAVFSPLHFLGMHYLFSAHMVMHLIILLIAAPLLVAGLSEDSIQPVKKYALHFSRWLFKYPWLAWGTGVGIMWLWHIPVVFDNLAQMDMNNNDNNFFSNLLAHAHISSLLIAGILFSWPILNPFEHYRIQPLAGVLYLATACVGCSLLGLLLTFAPMGIYHHYSNMPDHYGLAGLLQQQWHITPRVDQQAAGLIMWIPGCFIYLAGAMYLLKRWFAESGGEKPGAGSFEPGAV